MLNWIRGAWDSLTGSVSGAIRSWVRGLLEGFARVLDTLFGDVTGAWDDLARDTEHDAIATGRYLEHAYDVLRQVVEHDIPHYAQTAWWWATHPQALSHVLFWHLVRELEDQAWTAGRYLGSFFLSLVWHNAERLAETAEDIISAVL